MVPSSCGPGIYDFSVLLRFFIFEITPVNSGARTPNARVIIFLKNLTPVKIKSGASMNPLAEIDMLFPFLQNTGFVFPDFIHDGKTGQHIVF
jgi:hypothetical protein